MPDYSKTVIYKIQHEDNEELVYIGSTTDYTKRKCQHKSNSNSPNNKLYNLKLYQMINDNGGWNCFKMIQLKEFSCNNKREAELEEDAVMLELKANMNSNRACRTRKEWHNDNKEHLSQQRKQYRQLNKEEVAQKDKEYYNKNKEQITRKNKRYYDKNKEQITQRKKEKIICDCGFIVNKNHLARHKQSSKHIKLLNETKEQ